MKYQQWKIAQQSQQVCREMERQGVPLLVAATLCARGLTDLDEAKALLSSAEDQLCDPYLMKDMDLATARIGRALRNKESIAVYGDYDVDGITATCLLTHYLRSQGGNVRYYIPDRLTEGYGVNNQAVEELALQGVTLIITVDCGITALAETAYAASLGVDMIVTDHHECKEKLPDAIAVVDPHREDCPYPFKDLAGVGVALKLVMALGSVSGGEKRANALFHEYADLAAVGTIADVMKLFGREPDHRPGGPKAPEKDPPPRAVRPHGGGRDPEPGHQLHHRGVLPLPPHQRRRTHGPGGHGRRPHPDGRHRAGRVSGPRAV